MAAGETKIILKNPKALYRIGILGYDETIKLDMTVEGNVGNFFGAFCNFDGTWIVNANAENGLADKGYKGKIIVEGFATELACQNNQATKFSNGVDLLIKKGCMERAMGQARGGRLVTFGAGYNSGLTCQGEYCLIWAHRENCLALEWLVALFILLKELLQQTVR